MAGSSVPRGQKIFASSTKDRDFCKAVVAFLIEYKYSVFQKVTVYSILILGHDACIL